MHIVAPVVRLQVIDVRDDLLEGPRNHAPLVGPSRLWGRKGDNMSRRKKDYYWWVFRDHTRFCHFEGFG